MARTPSCQLQDPLRVSESISICGFRECRLKCVQLLQLTGLPEVMDMFRITSNKSDAIFVCLRCTFYNSCEMQSANGWLLPNVAQCVRTYRRYCAGNQKSYQGRFESVWKMTFVWRRPCTKYETERDTNPRYGLSPCRKTSDVCASRLLIA